MKKILFLVGILTSQVSFSQQVKLAENTNSQQQKSVVVDYDYVAKKTLDSINFNIHKAFTN